MKLVLSSFGYQELNNGYFLGKSTWKIDSLSEAVRRALWLMC